MDFALLSTESLQAELRAAYGEDPRINQYDRATLENIVTALVGHHGDGLTQAVRTANRVGPRRQPNLPPNLQNHNAEPAQQQPVGEPPEFYQTMRFGDLALAVLKEECKAWQLRVGGTQRTLINRLRELFEQRREEPRTEPVQRLFRQTRERRNARRIVEGVRPFPRINYDNLPFEHWTLPLLREEMQLLHLDTRGNKNVLLARFRERLNLIQPTTFSERIRRVIMEGPVREVIAQPIPRETPMLVRDAPQVQLPTRQADTETIDETRCLPFPEYEGPDSPYLEGLPNDVNLYLYLGPYLVNYLSRGLTYGLTGTPLEKAGQMHAYDEIMPDIKAAIVSKHIHELENESTRVLILYGMYARLNMRYILRRHRYTVRYSLAATVSLLLTQRHLKQTRPPPRDVTHPNLPDNLREASAMLLRLGKQRSQYNQTRTLTPDLSRRLWTDFQKYPPTVTSTQYMLAREWIPYCPAVYDQVLTMHGYTQEYLDCLDFEDKVFIITRGYARLSDDEIASVMARVKKLRSVSVDVRVMLAALYEVGDQAEPEKAILQLKEHPYEGYIHWYGQKPLDELVVGVGMLPPPACASKEAYVRENLPNNLRNLRVAPMLIPPVEQWSKFRLREMDGFTDIELITAAGAYINYNSRNALLGNLHRAVTTPTFFVPLKRNCQNKETYSGLSTDDPAVFMVAYGTLTTYEGYELDELYASFSNEDLTKFTKFTIPGKRELFPVEALNALLGLMRNYPGQAGTDVLAKRINEGLAEMRQAGAEDRRRFQEVQSWDASAQSVFKDFLQAIFAAGMYMRRWEGPGNPYPIASDKTIRNIDPDINVTAALNRMEDIYAKLSPSAKTLLNGIKVIRWSGNQATPDTDWFMRKNDTNLYQRVREGHYCIRQASSRFVWTGYYYLQFFFNEEVPGFRNPEALAIIQ